MLGTNTKVLISWSTNLIYMNKPFHQYMLKNTQVLSLFTTCITVNLWSNSIRINNHLAVSKIQQPLDQGQIMHSEWSQERSTEEQGNKNLCLQKRNKKILPISAAALGRMAMPPVAVSSNHQSDMSCSSSEVDVLLFVGSGSGWFQTGSQLAGGVGSRLPRLCEAPGSERGSGASSPRGTQARTREQWRRRRQIRRPEKMGKWESKKSSAWSYQKKSSVSM